MKHSHIRRSGSELLCKTDGRQDRRILRAAVAARKVTRGEIRARVVPAVSTKVICASGQAYRDTAKHGYFGVMKLSHGGLNVALLSSKITVGSFCKRVIHVHVYGVDLLNVIFRSDFAQKRRPHSSFMV